jgi:hypothetical protein
MVRVPKKQLVIRRAIMNTQSIDEAIDKYVHERMVKGRKRASERFLSYAHLKYAGEELAVFMKKVGGLSRYYMDFLNVMENPFRGPELAWLASMIVVGIYSCYLLTSEDSRLTGIMVFSGTLVHGWALLRMACQKWREIGVMIAIYREIAEIADQEAATPA